MTALAVLAVQLRTPPQHIAPGVSILARVTMQVGPILLSGCNLTHSAEHGHRLLMPSRNREERAVILCPLTRKAAVDAAVTAYKAEINSTAALPVATAPKTPETVAT